MIPKPPTALDAIRRAGIIVASDTGEYNSIAAFFLNLCSVPIVDRAA